ncbi:MAG: aminopeptidase [Candidatus Atabeyarchaeum deiterrae]
MYEEMAKLIVKDALRIKSSDVVSILTFPHTVDAANAIAIECFKQGADAMLVLWTDDYYYGQLEHLSEDSLKEPSKFCQALTEAVTAQVNMFGLEDPDGLKKISYSKSAAWNEGERRAHFPRGQERKIRTANLTLPLVTKARAKTYGFNFGAWKKAVDEATTADLKEISQKCHRVASSLEKANDVRITAPNGTDLTFELAGRPVHIDDGIIDEDDIANNSLETQLPTGFVQTTVVESSANGKIFFDLPLQALGVNVVDLEWGFKEGRLTSMMARKNIESLATEMQSATGDKDIIAFLGIGLNRKAKQGFMMNNIVEGAVTIGVGDNEALGGQNKSPYGAAATIGEATLEIDGKAIVKAGRLVEE